MRERYFAPVLIDKRMAPQIKRSSLKPQNRCWCGSFACLRRCNFGKESCEPLLIHWLREKCVCIWKYTGPRLGGFV